MSRQYRMNLTRVFMAASLMLAVVLGQSVMAEEVTGHWRFELQLGGSDAGDEIRSTAGRQMTILQQDGSTRTLIDPRPTDLLLEDTQVIADPRIDLRAAYGFKAWKNTEMLIDVGIGYYEAKIDKIEISSAIDRLDIDYLTFGTQLFGRYGEPEAFQFDRIGEIWVGDEVEGGTMTIVPISANVLFRFRPTKRLNPYLGGGIGYYFVKFDPSPAWVAIADQLDASCVAYAVQGLSYQTRQLDLDWTSWDTEYALNETPDLSGLEALGGDSNCIFRTGREEVDGWIPDGEGGQTWGQVGWKDTYQNFGKDLERPRIDTPDTMFLEVRGGMEWQWKPKTAFFVDFGFTWAAKEIRITVDGREQFGEGLPAGVFPADQIPSPAQGATAYITHGGMLLPGGFDGEIQRQPGEYIIQGGTLDYGGWNFAFGIRFTL